MKIFIAYGWPEGKKHARLLEKALENAGYEITNFQNNADIVVAHSAGCYMLSPESKNKLVMLVGLPNWPNKPVYKSTWQKVGLEDKNRYWFTKTLVHAFYALHILTTIKTWQAFQNKLIRIAQDARVILIHNKQDTYMHDKTSKELAESRGWDYKGLEGQHDDIWENPEPYVEIINSIVDLNQINRYKNSFSNREAVHSN